MGRLSHDTD
jgi:hypothetical protein